MDTDEFMFVWDDYYKASPNDTSMAEISEYYADHCTSGFTFDGHTYRWWSADPVLPPEVGQETVVVQCPGPLLPPLQGPPPTDCGVYWAEGNTAFVYDEERELALREGLLYQQVSLPEETIW